MKTVVLISLLILTSCSKSSRVVNPVNNESVRFKTAINDHPQYAVQVPAKHGYYLGDSIVIDNNSINKSITVKGNTQFVAEDVIDSIVLDGPIPETLDPCAHGTAWGIQWNIYCGDLNVASKNAAGQYWISCLSSSGFCFAIPDFKVYVF